MEEFPFGIITSDDVPMITTYYLLNSPLVVIMLKLSGVHIAVYNFKYSLSSV